MKSSSGSPDWCYRLASRAGDDRRAAAALHARARSWTKISSCRRASSYTGPVSPTLVVRPIRTVTAGCPLDQ